MRRRIQALLRWCFLKVEGLFNLAFGEKLNPLYYIGPISYYLMWVIVASGLYLYAFFKTSVDGAQASVEALTHAQPWAGGVLRSVHRYASDGVVLTMLLHMAPARNSRMRPTWRDVPGCLRSWWAAPRGFRPARRWRRRSG